jgi:hypothetical protein
MPKSKRFPKKSQRQRRAEQAEQAEQENAAEAISREVRWNQQKLDHYNDLDEDVRNEMQVIGNHQDFRDAVIYKHFRWPRDEITKRAFEYSDALSLWTGMQQEMEDMELSWNVMCDNIEFYGPEDILSIEKRMRDVRLKMQEMRG